MIQGSKIQFHARIISHLQQEDEPAVTFQLK